MYRHPKTNRPVWNHPLCTDDFGNLVYECFYTKKKVTTAACIFLGPCIPQAIGTYVCAKDAHDAFREAKRAFDEIDANCNTCINFKRLPHDKDPIGLVRGTCKLTPIVMYRSEFWVHPDDAMGMTCWVGRAPKQKHQ